MCGGGHFVTVIELGYVEEGLDCSEDKFGNFHEVCMRFGFLNSIGGFSAFFP